MGRASRGTSLAPASVHKRYTNSKLIIVGDDGPSTMDFVAFEKLASVRKLSKISRLVFGTMVFGAKIQGKASFNDLIVRYRSVSM